ncbi:dual specificity phosphatase, catalytic domain containing protein [Acanthamoeba castellanii str. Neff]|uniref:Dual specificity phosphatase, catalytic domain containing protein n=1 Tax=Acanthamoeba castellanii (strain ATCC 30010 / Neff) TaxID=1257118 RepID=L8GPB0_ACACF|nr:dual specificity phosphatase, catalytic domain containing protein [Acanthamoeba castellanii str. Neff]ELR14732.1 dual specificity phosphatase, catalytic domain containing protein [Acanthamoeba castellanii str. Neff]
MDHYQFMLRMVSPEPGLPAEEVFPGLFLGELGAVYKRIQLKEQKIGSILSAECMPPLWPDDFRYMVIKADETENCNLLEVLEHALKFMQDGLKNGKVLVSTEEALAVVGRRRRVFPNTSFLEQLRWFHEHQWSVDKQTADYRELKARYSTPAQIIECPP